MGQLYLYTNLHTLKATSYLTTSHRRIFKWWVTSQYSYIIFEWEFTLRSFQLHSEEKTP